MKDIKICSNKKANFNYEIEDKYIAGMRITGTEIKSIRNKDVSINESYCFEQDGEIFIKNMYIKKYEYGSDNNHEEYADRKLLLTKQEIKQITKKLEEKGYSLVPTRVIIRNGWAKMEVGLGKGRKNYNKKEYIKEKDIKRETDRSVKYM